MHTTSHEGRTIERSAPRLLLQRASPPSAVQPPMAHGAGIMDTLALLVSEACCHFLDWQQLLPGKPELLVGTGAVRQGAVEYFVYPIASQIAVAPGILAGIPAIDIQVGTASQPDQALFCLFWLGGPGSRESLLDKPGFGVCLFPPAPTNEIINRERIELGEDRLHLLPRWSHPFGQAATRVGGKAVDTWIDALHACLQQIRHELIEVGHILGGGRLVANRMHLRLARQCDGAQALQVGALPLHHAVVDLACAMEGEPEHRHTIRAQGSEYLTPIGTGRQRNPGGREWIKGYLPQLLEKHENLSRLRMGEDFMHGIASEGELVRRAEAAHFV